VQERHLKLHTLINILLNAMTQGVIRQLLFVESRVQSQADLGTVCCGNCSNEIGFPLCTVFLYHYFSPVLLFIIHLPTISVV